MGDFNEVIGRDPTPLTTMFSKFGLVNLMTVRHSDPQPATYARGRKCIDYGFGTPRVANALQACGYEAFNARFTTDHRSYFFDFSTEHLFGTSTPMLANPALRILQSKNVKQTTSYIKIVYDYLTQCNAFERAKRSLCHPGNQHAYAERLDKDMIQACLMAEKRIKRYGEPTWSIALDQARKKAVILRKCLSTIRTGLDITEIIQERNRNLDTPMELPRTKQECCDQLRLAKREIENIVDTSVKHREDEIKQRITSLEPVLTNLKSEVPAMTVTDPHTNTTCELEYLNPYSAHKTLGCYKEPAGTQVTQFKQLKEKSDSITSFLWSTPLARGEAWTYYTACYLPSVCYPLTASHLTTKQLRKIQQNAMMIVIPRCGFNRNTHRSIIYGPYQLGGATFRHLAVEQGVLQVAYFLRQWRMNSLVGDLLRCSVAWLQALVGTSYSAFQHPQTPLPHLESKWLASMLSIHLDNTYIPPLQRQHDEYIMDLLMSSNHYTPTELRKLNYC